VFRIYTSTFIIALSIAYILTPVVQRISISMNWLDKPNYRKINKKPMPLMGGIAIFLAFLIAIALSMFEEPFANNIDKFVGFLASSFIIVLVGFQDDTKGMSARRKLTYQIAAALVAANFGFTIIKVSHPLGGAFYAPLLVSMTITVFWIVGFTNAINLLDGLDGLASGVVAIIAGSLFFASIKINNPVSALLSIALAGSSLGFLRFNFHPAKIFMGDTGSMFMGFALSLISIEGAYKSSTLVTLLIPIIAMGIPVIDTGLSILRRLTKGNDVFKPDKEHIHHKLLTGGSHREAVLRLYFLTACFGLIAISLAGIRGIWVILALIATGLLALRWVVNSGFLDFVDEKDSV